MISRLRHRRLPLLFSVFALLAQLLLPTVHAQAWAERSGDARLYAYCGQVSAAVAQSLGAQIAAAAADRDGVQLDPGAQPCAACASLHAALLVPSPPAALPQLLRSRAQPDRAGLVPAGSVRLIRLPPAQAPPLAS